MNKKIIVLEDIDRTTYPFEEQFSKYLKKKYGGKMSPKFFSDFNRSTYDFIADYLQNDHPDIKEYLDQLRSIHIEINQKNNEEFINEITMRALREFGNSDEFKKGYNKQMQNLNRLLKKNGATIIGLTARGTEENPDMYYDNCKEKTMEWVKINSVPFDNVYYYSTAEKYLALQHIPNEYEVGLESILCIIEDEPKAVEGFLNRGVISVLIKHKRAEKIAYANMLKDKYADMLIIRDTHAEAKDAVLELYMDRMRYTDNSS